MSETGITILEFAKRHGVAKQSVSAAIKSGRISKGVHVGKTGKVLITDPELAAQEWHANSMLMTGAKFGLKTPDQIPDVALDIMKASVIDGEEPPPDARIENSWLARYRKELTHLELQTKQGLLIDKGEMQKQLFKVFREVRDSLLNIPSKIAPEVVAMDDPFEVQAYIEKQIRESLEALVKYAVEKGVVDEP
jgi:hypothetical protein